MSTHRTFAIRRRSALHVPFNEQPFRFISPTPQTLSARAPAQA